MRDFSSVSFNYEGHVSAAPVSQMGEEFFSPDGLYLNVSYFFK